MDAFVSLFSRSPKYQSLGKFHSSDFDRIDGALMHSPFLGESWLFYKGLLKSGFAVTFPFTRNVVNKTA
jgi:hypothetical protein